MNRSRILCVSIILSTSVLLGQQKAIKPHWGLDASLTDDRLIGLVYQISTASRVGLSLGIDMLKDTAEVSLSEFFVRTRYQQTLGIWDKVVMFAGAGVGFGGGDVAGIAGPVSFGRMRLDGSVGGEYQFSESFAWYGSLQLNYDRRSFVSKNEVRIYTNANTGFVWWFN